MNNETRSIDLNFEIGEVQSELLQFRETVLPALVDDPNDGLLSLPLWEEATQRMVGALSRDRFAHSTLSRLDFTLFIGQPAQLVYSVRDGRIIWRISVFIDLTLRPLPFQTFQGDPMDFSAIRHWLITLPVDSQDLWNGLCCVLPTIADADPDFARFALDKEAWRNAILADRDLPEERKQKQLQFLDGSFGYILHNALLHVLAALANNHFPLVAEYLRHPCLHGRYRHLIPQYLFAVLFEKVALLRRLVTL